MSTQMHNEIESLSQDILVLGSDVKKNIEFAYNVLFDFKHELIEEAVDNDVLVNNAEVAIEEKCIKILTLYQPVATDLRTVIAILKINSDLERMSDLAKAICIYTKNAYQNNAPEIPEAFNKMFELTLNMTQKILDCLVKIDEETLIEIRDADLKVDKHHKKTTKLLTKKLSDSNVPYKAVVALINISKNIERIGDYATNIAEDLYYIINGDIVRHNTDKMDN